MTTVHPGLPNTRQSYIYIRVVFGHSQKFRNLQYRIPMAKCVCVCVSVCPMCCPCRFIHTVRVREGENASSACPLCRKRSLSVPRIPRLQLHIILLAWGHLSRKTPASQPPFHTLIILNQKQHRNRFLRK